MASYDDTRVAEALMDRVRGVSLSPPLPVAWPGVDFAPPQAGYLAVSLLPAETTGFGVGDEDDVLRSGVLQVSVFWPEDRGVTAPMERAGAVAAHFPRGLRIYREGVRVRVERPPTVAPPLFEPGWVQVPVSVYYQA